MPVATEDATGLRLPARLVYDMRFQPLPTGVRAARQRTRRVMLAANEIEVTLQVSSGAAVDRGGVTHKELSGKTLPPIDTTTLDPRVNVPTKGTLKDHGTYVASLALRAAPRAKVLPVRVLNEDGFGTAATAGTTTCTGATPSSQTAWLKAADGWDAKNSKSLTSDGKLYVVQTSDNTRLDLEGRQFVSFRFQGGLPAGAKVTEARLYVEHYEEAGFASGAVTLEVGGGSLTSPTTLGSLTPPILATESKEATVEWVVTQWITTGAQANDLKLVVHNRDTVGKKVKLDSVFLIVRYTTSQRRRPVPRDVGGTGRLIIRVQG